MNAGPHSPLLTALFVLTPERDADGHEAHEEDLDGHASPPSIGYANASNGENCSVAVIGCEEIFLVCSRKFLNAGATRHDQASNDSARDPGRVSRTIYRAGLPPST